MKKKTKDSIVYMGKTIPVVTIKDLDYKVQNDILAVCGNAIQYIEKPTEEQKQIAIKQNGYAIRYVSNPSYELQRMAVSQQATAIQFIESPYPDLLEKAFEKDPNVLLYINNPSYEQMKSAVSRKGGTIQYIKNPSVELIELAIEQNPMSVSHLTKPEHDIILKAIQKKPQSIKNIINKIPRDLVIEALKRNGNLIKYIKEKDDELIAVALTSTPSAIQFVSNPSVEQQVLAVSKTPSIITSLPNPTEEVKIAAIHAKPSIITSFPLTPKIAESYNEELLKCDKQAKKDFYKAGVLPAERIRIQQKYRNFISQSLKDKRECVFLNQYDESLIDILIVLAEIVKPEKVDIASGFLYKSGISLLKSIITPVMQNHGKIELIIGALQHYDSAKENSEKCDGIDYDTARYLKGLQNLDLIQLFTYTDRFFHGKYYLMHGAILSAVIVGSSNVSSSGLLLNSELNTIFVCANSDIRLKKYKEWYSIFASHCQRLGPLNLELFLEAVEEKDIQPDWTNYGTMSDISNFVKKVSSLSDSEVQMRLSTWLKHSPSRVLENINIRPFEGYVLFEFHDRGLFVFESFVPGNAFYCFSAKDFSKLQEQLAGKTKTQLYKDTQLCQRGYHMSNRDFEIYVASIF